VEIIDRSWLVRTSLFLNGTLFVTSFQFLRTSPLFLLSYSMIGLNAAIAFSHLNLKKKFDYLKKETSYLKSKSNLSPIAITKNIWLIYIAAIYGGVSFFGIIITMIFIRITRPEMLSQITVGTSIFVSMFFFLGFHVARSHLRLTKEYNKLFQGL